MHIMHYENVDCILSLNVETLKLQSRCSKPYHPIQKYSLIEKTARPKKTTPEARNCGDRQVGIEQIIYSKKLTDDSKRGKEGRGSTNSTPHLHLES